MKQREHMRVIPYNITLMHAQHEKSFVKLKGVTGISY